MSVLTGQFCFAQMIQLQNYLIVRDEMRHKPTIGFISTWSVYQGTTIDRCAHSLIQGISAAASEQGCNLLLGCGFSATGNNPQDPSFWPVRGPWNTDGLIIVPDELTKEQSQYVHDLLESGFPVIFTTPEGPGVRKPIRMHRIRFLCSRCIGPASSLIMLAKVLSRAAGSVMVLNR